MAGWAYEKTSVTLSALCGLIVSDSLLNHGGPLGLGLFELRITRIKRIGGAVDFTAHLRPPESSSVGPDRHSNS